MIEITIQQRVKAACDIAGMSLTELGKRMGMSQQTFSSRLKVGKFRQDELEKMAEILGCKYISIFEKKAAPPTTNHQATFPTIPLPKK